LLADDELGGDVGVRSPAREEAQHLDLARRQCVGALEGLQAPELEPGQRTLELRNDSNEPSAVFLVSYKPGKTDEDLVAWEEGGMKGPAPGSFHGGAIDVPAQSSVYYTYTFERGVEYALVDDVNRIEKRFSVD
jgi:hypothetical protein